MNRNIKFSTALFFLVFSNMSCVSVSLKKSEISRSDKFTYQSPGSPFSKVDSEHVDSAWRNSKNGNSISMVSDCDSVSDPTHTTILDGVTSGLQDLSTQRKEFTPYNNRQALNVNAIGKVDGVSTQLEILILKKSGCIYVLTYVGLPDHFSENIETFNRFKREFVAQ